MPTFDIIRIITRQERFTVEANDPGDAIMRLDHGEAARRGETTNAEVVAFERPAHQARIGTGGPYGNR